MFVIMSLLASSIDGFVWGFLLKSIGVEFDKKDYLKILFTIFVCCLAACETGKIFSHTKLTVYINLIGAVVMIYLAVSALVKKENSNFGGVYAVAVSVAADAGIVCLYLGMSGYNIVAVALTSRVMHTFLMKMGDILSHRLIGEKFSRVSRYISRGIFLFMAIIKLKSAV